MGQRYKTLLLLGVTLTGCGGVVESSLASCRFDNGTNIAQALFNTEGDFQPVSITVGANTPAGTILHTEKIRIPPVNLTSSDCFVDGPAKLTWLNFPTVTPNASQPGVVVVMHLMHNGIDIKPTDKPTVGSVQDINDYVSGLSLSAEVRATGAPLSPGVIEYLPDPYSLEIEGQDAFVLFNSPGGERLSLNIALGNTPP